MLDCFYINDSIIELALWTATSFGKVLDHAAQQSKVREHVKVRRQRPACLFSIDSCSIRLLCNNTHYIISFIFDYILCSMNGWRLRHHPATAGYLLALSRGRCCGLVAAGCSTLGAGGSGGIRSLLLGGANNQHIRDILDVW